MFKLISALKDLLIVLLFLLFLERYICLTFPHFVIFILSTIFGYYFEYRSGQKFRHMQIIIKISDCISRLKNKFGN